MPFNRQRLSAKFQHRLLFSAFLLLLLGAGFAPAAFSAAFSPGTIGILIDGRSLPLEVNPVITGGRVLVPIRGVAEGLDTPVHWDASSRVATIGTGQSAITLRSGSNQAMIGAGQSAILDVPAQIASGRIMVPLRFIGEHLGAFVTWNDGTRTVSIRKAPLITGMRWTRSDDGSLTLAVLASAPLDHTAMLDKNAPFLQVRIPFARLAAPGAVTTAGAPLVSLPVSPTGSSLVSPAGSPAFSLPVTSVEATQAALSVDGRGALLSVALRYPLIHRIGAPQPGEGLRLFFPPQVVSAVHRRESGRETLTLISTGPAAARTAVERAPGALTAGIVTRTNVNVRSGPGLEHSIVGTLNRGDSVTVIGGVPGWFEVRFSPGGGPLAAGAGTPGWIADWLMEVVAPVVNSGQAGGGSAGEEPAESRPAPFERLGLVNGDNVNVRGGPGLGYPVLKRVNRDHVVVVTQEKDGWYYGSLEDGSKGWFAGWLVEMVKEGSIARTDVNVRSGPGLNETILTRVDKGDPVIILSQAQSWYQVRLADGRKGWIADWLVEVMDGVGGQGGGSSGAPAAGNGTGQAGGGVPGGNTGLPGAGERLVVELAGIAPGALAAAAAPAGSDYISALRVAPLNTAGGSGTGGDNSLRLTLDLSRSASYRISSVDNLQKEGGSGGQVGSGGGGAPADGGPAGTPAGGSEPSLGGLYETTIILGPALSAEEADSITRGIGTGGDPAGSPLPADLSGILSGRIIGVDAGHGGSDPGTSGPSKVKEKTLTLDLALRLARMLREAGARVIMTREADVSVSNPTRVNTVHAGGAEVFISIHLNGYTNPAINGTETLYRPSAANDRLARLIQGEFLRELGLADRGLMVRPNLYILRESRIPVALAEVGYLTNPSDENRLLQAEFRERAALALLRAIVEFFKA